MRDNYSGNLYIKNDIWQMSLSRYENIIIKDDGVEVVKKKRVRKSISTKIKVEADKPRKAQIARREAEVLLEKTLQEYNGLASFKNKEPIPFYQFLEYWLAEHKNNIRPSTYESYRLSVQGKIIPYFLKTGLTVQELIIDDIEGFYREMRKTVSYNTVKHYKSNINKVLDWAVIKKMIPFNPATNAQIPKNTEITSGNKTNQKFKGKTYSKEQINELLKVAKDSSIEVPIMLTAYYGLRRSEVVGLKWSAIDFDRRIISIEHTVVDVNGKRYISDDTKNESSNRTLPLSEKMLEYLLSVKESQKQDKELCGNCYKESDYICRLQDGTPMKPNYITRHFSKMLKENNMEKKGEFTMNKTREVYCENCKEKVNYTVRREIINEYKGYEVNVLEKIGVCSICNNDLYIPQLESENFKNLYEKYRELANIISAEEIVEFRDKYNISQRELTSILNWGKMTINRYERGAIPGQSHNDLLSLIICNENIFKDKVEGAFQDGRITEKTYEKIKNKLSDSTKNILKDITIDSLTHKEDEFNGYRKFDIERLINLISYIADNVELYKTSLNKYLWFVDLLNFKKNVRSITGLRYIKYTYGPVIEDFKYEDILNYFDDKFYKEEYENGSNIQTKIKSKGNYDLSLFKDEEIEVINNVINILKEKKCKEISLLSHKEDGWIKNNDRDLISYEYADNLNPIFS